MPQMKMIIIPYIVNHPSVVLVRVNDVQAFVLFISFMFVALSCFHMHTYPPTPTPPPFFIQISFRYVYL